MAEPQYPPLKIDPVVKKEVVLNSPIVSLQGEPVVNRPPGPLRLKVTTLTGPILSAQGMAVHEIEARKQRKREAGVKNPRDRQETMNRPPEERVLRGLRLARLRNRKWRAKQRAAVEQYAPSGFLKRRRPLMRDREAEREQRRAAVRRWVAKQKADPEKLARWKASLRLAQQRWHAKQKAEGDPVKLEERRVANLEAQARWRYAKGDPALQAQRRAANREAQARWRAKADGDPALQEQRRLANLEAQARYRARKKAGTVQDS